MGYRARRCHRTELVMAQRSGGVNTRSPIAMSASFGEEALCLSSNWRRFSVIFLINICLKDIKYLELHVSFVNTVVNLNIYIEIFFFFFFKIQ